MGRTILNDSLYAFKTAIKVAQRGDTWIIYDQATVLSETAYAIHAAAPESSISIFNDGTLVSRQDYAVRLDGVNNFIVNTETGAITGWGGIKAGPQSKVSNKGSIITYSETRPAIQIDSWGSSGGPAHIDNSGTIGGATAIRDKGGAALHVTNDGTITGLITLGAGNDRISSYGIIDGEVRLGGGRDVFIGTGGDAVSVDGGRGRDLIVGGDGADHLVGGRGRDKLYGGGGDDTLVGCYGRDVLEGGGGSDTFVFLNTKGVDRVRDFTVGEDSIQLSSAAFRKIGAKGELSADAFQLGSRADDAEDRVIYDPRSGLLKYDANGDAAGGTKVIAKLAPGLDLTHGHFEII